jgi:hypothetical protein
MRDGIEFEFDVCGDLDQDNTLTISKSRCPDLAGKVINRPSRDLAVKVLIPWLTGAAVEPTPATTPRPSSKPIGSAKPDWFKSMLESFAALKAKVKEETRSHTIYYDVLGAHGYEHANEIPDRETAKRVYAAIVEAMRPKRGEPFTATDDDVPANIGAAA